MAAAASAAGAKAENLVDSPDPEGRCITAVFDSFVLIATYCPHPGGKNGSDGTGPQYLTLDFRCNEWEPKLRRYMCELRKRFHPRPLIWAGDLNVSHSTELETSGRIGRGKDTCVLS